MEAPATLMCREHPGAHLIEDFRSGDHICTECGLVVSRGAIDVGSEWRTFSSDRCSGDPSRVGGCENPLLSGTDLRTTIEPGRGEKAGSKGLKYKRKNKAASADRVLIKAFQEIGSIGERLHLPKVAMDLAKNTFTEVHEKPLLKPRSKDATATACLYIACRQENIPRTFKEVYDAAKTSKREICRCYKLVLRQLNTYLDAVTVEDFMPRFCSNLGLPLEIQKAATRIAKNAVAMDLVAGKSPITVTASSIYMASQASANKKSHKEIAEVTGLAAATIRQTYKLMSMNARDLFPPGFQFVTPLDELPLA